MLNVLHGTLDANAEHIFKTAVCLKSQVCINSSGILDERFLKPQMPPLYSKFHVLRHF